MYRVIVRNVSGYQPERNRHQNGYGNSPIDYPTEVVNQKERSDYRFPNDGENQSLNYKAELAGFGM